MATIDEDFSFPATTTPPLFIDSPPLWRQSSAPASFFHREKHDYRSKGKGIMSGVEFIDLCSFQELETSTSRKMFYDEEDEKMDSLWEDLNEKFSRNSGKIEQRVDNASPVKEVHVRCVNVRALKMSKVNGNLPSVLVFIKVLKKIFVMHNSRRTIKKRAW